MPGVLSEPAVTVIVFGMLDCGLATHGRGGTARRSAGYPTLVTDGSRRAGFAAQSSRCRGGMCGHNNQLVFRVAREAFGTGAGLGSSGGSGTVGLTPV